MSLGQAMTLSCGQQYAVLASSKDVKSKMSISRFFQRPQRPQERRRPIRQGRVRPRRRARPRLQEPGVNLKKLFFYFVSDVPGK
jgi:hypothetical protein